jgi:hypothetical protein
MAEGLFLDFDGVICDCVNECFVSSWLAFHDRYRGDSPQQVTLADYARFCAMRPFVRSGEDYVLIHELVSEDLVSDSQATFDAAVERAGWEQMATFRSLLVTVREELVSQNLGYWLSLHHAYPGLRESLQIAAASGRVWVVSTKHSGCIRQILSNEGVVIPDDHVGMPVRGTKVQLIEAIMKRESITSALFVDDQIDHLRYDGPLRIRCKLAVWGHASREALAVNGVSHITMGELVENLHKVAGL